MLILKGKNVLITGAASGIGKALAECFAREGSNLFLGSHPREEDQLCRWADYLEHQYHIKTKEFPVDLALVSGPELLHKQVAQTGEGIDILVNNAGVMLYGGFAELPLDRQIEMISVNVIAYAKLMRLFLPDLMKRKSGRILNVVSASAFQPTPHHAVYGATKAFVQSLSEAVGQEIKASGIKICTLNPSYTDTPMLRGKGFPKKLWWFSISGLSSPEDIARKGVNAFKKGKLIYIPGVQNWFAASVLTRIFPRRMASYIPSLVLKEKGNRKRQK
ncbi:MAG: SDR family oxidoreductase [Deltaproteobacteria bacterium]|nr:MAG: SDR family oxidoreductase [Deltaproteobacteria bacterium]